jgi:predicted dehydrogenase
VTLVKLAVVGLGKMGLSHQAIANAHPDVDLVAICDSSRYVLGVLEKYTGTRAYADYSTLLREVSLDGVIVATPSRTHAEMVREALELGLHVFCEKPFTLAAEDSLALSELAKQKGVVTQVGYHNRFVGAFREAKRIVDSGALGTITHALAEAYGPVVLKPQSGTWRTKRDEGGGCLYDYAAHPIDLLTWYLGEPTAAVGTVLKPVFSRETEDEVYSTLFFPDGQTAHVSVSWSDDSQRKMTTRLTLWGTAGRLYVDRQECQVYFRREPERLTDYGEGWNVRYTTELTEPVRFYLRGEEYTAQIDHFVDRIVDRTQDSQNSFASATTTDRTLAMLVDDASSPTTTSPTRHVARPERRAWRPFRRMARTR